MTINKHNIKYLKDLRQHLHRHPELSGEEKETSERVEEELRKTSPDDIITGLGGYGLAAVFGSGDGPTLMLRSELDALPVTEAERNTNRSLNEGVSHACGHDGHMAILIGVARALSERRPVRGRIILMFQPSEETGTGAQRVIEDPRFPSLKADRSYAIHNLPGFDAGSVFIRDGAFAAASVGLKCTITGVSSHAAYPEQGQNPVRILPKLIQFIEKTNRPDITSSDYAIATITYISLGEKSFGITPGQAEIGLTFRACFDDNLTRHTETFNRECTSLCDGASLTYRSVKTEPFAATLNSKMCVDMVKAAAASADIPYHHLESPFPWSEDFGHFSAESEGALIGLGAGHDIPHLHAESYEFNDDIISTGVSLFLNILENEWDRMN